MRAMVAGCVHSEMGPFRRAGCSGLWVSRLGNEGFESWGMREARPTACVGRPGAWITNLGLKKWIKGAGAGRPTTCPAQREVFELELRPTHS